MVGEERGEIGQQRKEEEGQTKGTAPKNMQWKVKKVINVIITFFLFMIAKENSSSSNIEKSSSVITYIQCSEVHILHCPVKCVSGDIKNITYIS